jgi:hypothetical protein
MSDATFEFNTDPVKAQQDQVKRRQAQDIAKRGLQQELQWTSEADLLQQEIAQKRNQMERRSAQRMARTMAEGSRRRLLESIGSEVRPTGRGFIPGLSDIPGAPGMPGVGSEAKGVTAFATQGLKTMVGAVERVTGALGILTAASTAAGAAVRSANQTQKEGFETYGDTNLAVQRAARALRMNPHTLLQQVTNSPDRAGALGYINMLAERAQLTGQRIQPGYLNDAFSQVRAGAMSWSAVTRATGENAYSRIAAAQGVNPNGNAARYLALESKRNRDQFAGVGPTRGGSEAEYATVLRDQWAQEHPWRNALWSWTGIPDLAARNTAHRDFDKWNNSPSYDQTVAPGTPQSPSIPQGVDTTTGGRSPAADAAIQHMANTIRSAVQSRKPNPYGGGVEP